MTQQNVLDVGDERPEGQAVEEILERLQRLQNAEDVAIHESS